MRKLATKKREATIADVYKKLHEISFAIEEIRMELERYDGEVLSLKSKMVQKRQEIAKLKKEYNHIEDLL